MAAGNRCLLHFGLYFPAKKHTTEEKSGILHVAKKSKIYEKKGIMNIWELIRFGKKRRWM